MDSQDHRYRRSCSIRGRGFGCGASDFCNETSQLVARTAPQSMDAKLQDLVHRGLIPRQTLESAPQSMDAKLQSLVNRGLIPRQTLESAPQSMDAKLQDLVNRGLIPRQTLDD